MDNDKDKKDFEKFLIAYCYYLKHQKSEAEETIVLGLRIFGLLLLFGFIAFLIKCILC